MIDFKAVLNSAQFDACTHSGGPLMILAGAGSGKTRVITHRIAYLILECGVDPSEILAVTFTNKAANEMRERVEDLLISQGYHDQPRSIGTFHSTCARLLRRYADRVGLDSNYSIYDDADQLSVLKSAAGTLFLPQDRRTLRELLERIATYKHRGLSPDAVRAQAETAEDDTLAQLYHEYEDRLRRSNAVDFGDLIVHCTTILDQEADVRARLQDRYRQILVDEFQDTNPVQYKFLRLLRGPSTELTIVGDDDQSIYRWRGAEPANMLTFANEFPETKIVKLEQNYRSTQPILDAASDLIAHNTERLEKRLWTDRAGGEPVRAYLARDDREEARFVSRRIREWCLDKGHAWSSVAIFVRVGAQTRVLEEQLNADGVPHRVLGGTAFYGRAEIKDLLAYLRLVVNPADDAALRRIVNFPSRGVGQKSVTRLENFAAQRQTSLREVTSLVASGELDLRGTARSGVSELSGVLDQVAALYLEGQPPSALLDAVIAETDFLEALDKRSGDRAHRTRDNVATLLGAMLDYEAASRDPTLDGFLERVALAPERTDSDSGPKEYVSLMTIHGAKGLEFDTVFVVGLEDEMLPYRRRDEEPDIEEERRLCYVAFTRARRTLYLSSAQRRRLHGNDRRSPVSRFLTEVAAEKLEWLGQPRQQSRPRSSARGPIHPAFNAPREPVTGYHYVPEEPPARVARPMLRAKVPTTEADGSAVIQVDNAFVAPHDRVQPGERVRHRRFGEGTVVACSKRPGGTMCTVDFGTSEKKIYARFLDRG